MSYSTGPRIGACALAFALALPLPGCSSKSRGDAAGPDPSVVDGGISDGGTSDGGPGDAGLVEGLVVDLGGDRRVDSGAHVTLDGSRTRSDAGAIASWAWRQTQGQTVELAGADTARSSFDAPVVGEEGATLGFELTVVDTAGRTGLATMLVEVALPTAIVETTSGGVIRRAMEDGRLDRDTAAQYLAFSLYGDPRLPQAYRGSERERSATWIVELLADEYDTLSPATQAVVAPFLLPPASPASYVSQQLARESHAAPVTWEHVERTHVAIWYLSTLASGEDLANQVADEAEAKIWPRLEAVWGADHMPILGNDGQSPDFIGVDGKLNVYFTPGLGGYGLMKPYHRSPTPTFIQLEETLTYSGSQPAGMIESLAHEMTHSCQFSYPHKQRVLEAKWLYEGVATWAEDNVYPATDSEHEYASTLLTTLGEPLDADIGVRAYGAYLFFQYVTHEIEDAAFVRRAFEQFQTRPALEAVDAAFTHGRLADHWGDFLEAAWNHGADGWFRKHDRLEDEARAEGGAQPETLGAAGPVVAKILPAAVRHLAGRFRHFIFDDARHRWITFYDGLRYALEIQTDTVNEGHIGNQSYFWTELTEEARRGAEVRLLTLKDGKWTNWDLWGAGAVGACRDEKAHRFEQVVVIFGDGQPEKGHRVAPALLDPVLWASNAGCWKWTGHATAASHGSPEITVSSDSTWERSEVTSSVMKLRNSQGSWTISGEVGGSAPEVCTASGSGNWNTAFGPYDPEATSIQVDMVLLAGPDMRTFLGAENGPTMNYTVTCRIGADVTSTYTQTTTLWPFTYEMYCANERLDLPLLGASGNVASGSVRCADGEDRTWNFVSQAEP